MFNVRRVSTVLAVTVGLVWVVWSLAFTPSHQPADASGDGPSAFDFSEQGPAVLKESSLAARYHLRKRTSRFFKRSTSPYRSGRVNTRARSYRGIRRVDAVDRQDSQESQESAARYHLRGRTTRFFGRAIV